MEFSKNGKILLVVGFVFILGLAAYLSVAFLNKNYTRVFTDQSPEKLAKIVDSLEQAGIAFEYPEAGSGILIEDKTLSQARIQLSKDAVFDSDVVGLEFFSESQHAMSDFYQKVNYQRALQGELERSLILIEGVNSARVHLAIPREKSFSVKKADIKAAVTIELTPKGRANEGDIVSAVVSLVANAVPELTEDKVSVLDSQGRAFTGSDDGMSSTGGTRQKTAVESNVEGKIKRLLAPFYDNDEVGVSAWVEVNNNKVSERAQGLDASKEPAVLKRTTETTQGSKSKSKSTVLNEEFGYQTLTREIEYESGNISRLTVSVLLPRSHHFSESELIALIKSAVGLDEARGDKLSVLQYTPETKSDTAISNQSMVNAEQIANAEQTEKQEIIPPVQTGNEVIDWFSSNVFYLFLALLALLTLSFAAFFSYRQRTTEEEVKQITADLKVWIEERKVEQNLNL
ncbi:flagellar M-ring protein FliF [Enterovibrio norvegicus]|uniref:flagellar basal-body MS-ring/collar protein FliF n=1 Tax=Enterovibrio norvegicus TaxID=188144 RepID=UPI00031291F5|nr:flagellar basal-body MS-ring/collar protein FliF [Enterovibrio norvegicus]OEE65020.1 flagellar M-ring protein FliF [Enterovibrio norvegicus]